MKVGEYIKERQPIIYIKLMAMCQKDLPFGEIVKLMSHAAYKRCRGAIRQIRSK